MSLNVKELFPELRVGDVVVKNRLHKRRKLLIGEVFITKEHKNTWGQPSSSYQVVGVRWRSNRSDYYYASQLEKFNVNEVRLEDYE